MPEAFGWVKNGNYLETRPASMVGRVAEIIRSADEVAIASSFLLADGNIERAITSTWGQRRCYVLLAATARLRQDIGNEFDKMAHDRHVATLKNIAGSALVRSSDDFHAKVVLADPGSDEPRGLFLTANLATEGLERNQELFVELEPDEVCEAESVLRWAFWEHSAHELAGDKLRDCKPLGKIKPAESKKILQTEPHRAIRRKIMEILDGRPKKITVASFGWDAGHAVVEKLCDLSRRGTSVTVLTRAGRKSTHAALEKMKKANIRILGFSWFHAKAVISDSHTLVMSANIERHGLEKGFELGLTLEGKRAEEVKKTVSGWIDNYQYEFKARGQASRGPPGTGPERPGGQASRGPPGTGPERPASTGTGPERPASTGTGRERPGGQASRGPPGTGPERPASTGTGPERPASTGTGPERPASTGTGPERPASTGTGPERPASTGMGPERPASTGMGPERPASHDNLQIRRSRNGCNLFYEQGGRGKEPDMSNVRLVKVLTEEDGIGGGINDLDENRIVVTKGKVIVADTAGRQLKVFDGDGVFAGSVACKMSVHGTPISPSIIALDSRNRIIAAEGSTVHILDPSGVSIKEFDVNEYTEGGYYKINYINTTSQDNIIVKADSDALMLDSFGKLLDKMPLRQYQWFGKNHILEESDDDEHTLYDLTGRNAKEHASKILKKYMMKQLGYGALREAALDDKGCIYAVGKKQSYIHDYPDSPDYIPDDPDYIPVVDPSGKEIKKIPHPKISDSINSVVALDHNRIAMSTYSRTSIWDGKEWRNFDVGGRIVSASNEGVVVQNDDYAYRLVPPDTVRPLLYKAGGIRIATDSMDRIIVAGHGCVKILNPDGGIVETIVDADGRGGRFGVIKAVAIDRQSRIVVRDGDHIRVFDSNGKFVQSFTEREYSAKVDARLAEFLGSYPYLAYDSHGRAVVALRDSGIMIRDGGIMMEDRGKAIEKIDAPDIDALTVDRWDRTIAAHGSAITIYDHTGRLVNSVHGRYIRADGVAADGTGRIIVSGRDSNSNGMIQVFGPVPRDAGSAEDPLHILKVRCARGEITREEYAEMKKILA